LEGTVLTLNEDLTSYLLLILQKAQNLMTLKVPAIYLKPMENAQGDLLVDIHPTTW